MSQGGHFIQNNLDDSDGETPVENPQARGGGQGFPAGGGNASSRGGNDPMTAFLGGLPGGMGGGQNCPVAQGQNLGGSGSNQLAAMLQSLSFDQGLGRGGEGEGNGGGRVSNRGEQFLALLKGLGHPQGSGGGDAGGGAKGLDQIAALLSGQRGEPQGSGQSGGMTQFFKGTGGAGNDKSSPSGQKNPDGGKGSEANRDGAQGSGQDPAQLFGVDKRGGGFPNPFAMQQMFGAGGGIGQEGGQTAMGGNKPPGSLGGLGSSSAAGMSGPQCQTAQLQAMMQMLGGAGGGPVMRAGVGGHPQAKREEEKKQPPAGINQNSNTDELLAAVTGDDPGRGRDHNRGKGVGQTGGPNLSQAGGQGLGQVGGQRHGLNLGQAGLGGKQTSQEQQLAALLQLVQNQDQGQGQSQGQMPQRELLGLAQVGFGKGQIPQGKLMPGMKQLLHGQGQGQGSMGGGVAGLGSMDRGVGGLGPMGGGVGSLGSMGRGLGGLSPVGRDLGGLGPMDEGLGGLVPMGEGLGSMGGGVGGLGAMGGGLGPMGGGLGPMDGGLAGFGPMGRGLGSMGGGVGGLGTMGRGLGGLGPMGEGLGPMGRGVGGLGPMGEGLGSFGSMGGGVGGLGAVGGGLGGLGPMGGGLGSMGRGGYPGQVPAIHNQDSRAEGPCTVIIVDCSGSVQGEPLRDAVKFISDFIDGLEEVQFESGLEENIALITVGANINIPQHLTNNYQKIRDVLETLFAEGPTILPMAFLFALTALIDLEKAIYNTNGHSILPRVIMLTDGRPTRDADVPGQVMNPEDQNLLVMKNFTLEEAYMLKELMMASLTCVPIGECDVAFLEMLAGVTGGHVRCLGDAHFLSRNFLHHFIAGKMKAAGVKSDNLAAVLKATEELTIADDADVAAILTIINKDEPNLDEWNSKLQEAGVMGGMGRGAPRQQGGLGMGGVGMTGLLSAGMGGTGMAALLGQGMGGPGMGGAGMAALMSQAMGGAGMSGAGAVMGGAGMAALFGQAMGGAGMGGFPRMGGLPGMYGLPGMFGMGGGQQPRSRPKSGFLRD